MGRVSRNLMRALREERPDLLQASLSLAEVEGRSVDPHPWRMVFDRMTWELRERLRGPEAPLLVLSRYLFRDWGFQAVSSPYGPEDILLDSVLRRRRGVPEALTILALELGWRGGLPLMPVARGERVLLRLDDGNVPRFLDVTRPGHALSSGDLPSPSAVSEREMVIRLLRRLKSVYRERDNLDRLGNVTDALLAFQPESPEDRRDRGLVRMQQDNPIEAKADLKRYLELCPDAGDGPVIREYLAEADQRLRTLSRVLRENLSAPS